MTKKKTRWLIAFIWIHSIFWASCPLWNWGEFKKERRILDISDRVLANRQQAFLTDLNTQLINLRAEMETQKMMLQKAREISQLRKRIAASALVKLRNGTITTSRYVDEVQKYQKAYYITILIVMLFKMFYQ